MTKPFEEPTLFPVEGNKPPISDEELAAQTVRIGQHAEPHDYPDYDKQVAYAQHRLGVRPPEGSADTGSESTGDTGEELDKVVDKAAEVGRQAVEGAEPTTEPGAKTIDNFEDDEDGTQLSDQAIATGFKGVADARAAMAPHAERAQRVDAAVRKGVYRDKRKK